MDNYILVTHLLSSSSTKGDGTGNQTSQQVAALNCWNRMLAGMSQQSCLQINGHGARLRTKVILQNRTKQWMMRHVSKSPRSGVWGSKEHTCPERPRGPEDPNPSVLRVHGPSPRDFESPHCTLAERPGKLGVTYLQVRGFLTWGKTKIIHLAMFHGEPVVFGAPWLRERCICRCKQQVARFYLLPSNKKCLTGHKYLRILQWIKRWPGIQWCPVKYLRS